MKQEDFKEFCDGVYDDPFFHVHTTEQFLWEEQASKSMITTFNLTSILDLGCGVGRWLKAAKDINVTDLCGLEFCFDRAKKYIYQDILENVSFGDVSVSFDLNRKFDCVLSVEVAEHILPQNSDCFVKNIIDHCQRMVIFTAAPPGQAGHGHINTQPKDFWIDLFSKRNFTMKTERLNSLLTVWNDIVPQYIKNNLMIFEGN